MKPTTKFPTLNKSPLREIIPTSAYLHIPFCRRRCYYCDFAVSVVGDRKDGSNFSPIQQYVDVLCEEICHQPIANPPLNTVFFGGGTPSLLSVSQLDQILTTLDRQFGIASEAEISMEIDPATFDLNKLNGFMTAGINRVSLGVQAFQDELLAACGRSHNCQEIYQAVDTLKQGGIDNFSLDLISGLPHQSLEHWQQSLAAVLEITPPHISIYDLIVEPVTAFGRYYQPGVAPLPPEETTAQMYRLAQQTLTDAGYQHYEISNYAKPGYQCQHNLVYWHNSPYYGLGMGAASYVGGTRLTRPRTTRQYYEWVHSDRHRQKATEPLDPIDILLETLMLGLRLAEGVDLTHLSQQFGDSIVEPILASLVPYQQRGWVIVTLDRDRTAATSSIGIKLSDPEGFLFSNTILADIFAQMSSEE
ncbi:MAG: radical SAM family heme chaperone HemW [Microcoleaceae cyanobacterium]